MGNFYFPFRIIHGLFFTTEAQWVICEVKVKVKVSTTCPRLKACRNSRGIAPLNPNLGARLQWVVNFTLPPLYLRVRTEVNIKQENYGLQSRSGLSWEIKIFCPCRVSNPAPYSPLLVSTMTTLSHHLLSMRIVTKILKFCLHLGVTWFIRHMIIVLIKKNTAGPSGRAV
jgi:hypothetical protein